MNDSKMDEIKHRFIDWDDHLNTITFEMLSVANNCSNIPIHILADSVISGAILFMCNHGYTRKSAKEFILKEYEINEGDKE